MTTADAPTQEPPLAADWAFVVQLRQGTSFADDRLRGRIEHIVSGHACLFASLEEARVFMEDVMASAGNKAP